MTALDRRILAELGVLRADVSALADLVADCVREARESRQMLDAHAARRMARLQAR